MSRIFCVLLAGLLLAGEAPAQEALILGNDAYRAGETVQVSGGDLDDVFLAGQRLRLTGSISGSAHMAGRWIDVEAEVGGGLYAAGQRVQVDAPIGGDVYAAAQRVRVSAPVAGDVTVASQSVDIRAAVGGDLRAMGSDVMIAGPVGDSLIATGEFLELDAEVNGDAVLTGAEMVFGPDARVGGTLTLYEQEVGATVVPESVVPADRLTRIKLDPGRMTGSLPPGMTQGGEGLGAALGSFVGWVLVVGAVTAVVALLAPFGMQDMRDEMAARPLWMPFAGFMAVSLLLGGGLVIALTLIGILLTPVFWLAAGLIGLCGFVVVVYALGSWLLGLLPAPSDARIVRVAEALLGALVMALIGLVPFVGWIAVLLLVFAGTGALALRLPVLARLAD